ncbi:hypothetical protein HU200_059541 [Digitaria exilis]|uniref:Reverse transcriptase zinc-binding domain-containing protein n=1 Tax=Digitaria exilis TaxID=1010633 RepID=A0A835AL26_9POAL|nr:hypothetical protein HU200_059541 [Digitaria exilis]
MEDIGHIFVSCLRAREVWRRLGILPGMEICTYPWLVGTSLSLPSSTHMDVVLLILWHIWKVRNAAIFDKHAMSRVDVLRRTSQDMDFWRCRYKRYAEEWDVWREYIAGCI